MARSIEEIQQEIIRQKAQKESLNQLNATSKTAIWRLWVYITAFAIHSLERIFDNHKQEIDQLIAQQKIHSARWYRSKALGFQYGFDLLPDSDVFDNSQAEISAVEESKIIKYAAVSLPQDQSILVVKIATENQGELAPITPEQKISFEAYLNEIKDVGVRISVINYLPDILRLHLRIYRDPLLIDSNGQSILTGEKPIETALKKYLKNLPFDGELVLAHLTDTLQKIPGVRIPHIVSAHSKWIDSEGNDYGMFEPIEVKKIPISGYFQMEDFNTIEYVV